MHGWRMLCRWPDRHQSSGHSVMEPCRPRGERCEMSFDCDDLMTIAAEAVARIRELEELCGKLQAEAIIAARPNPAIVEAEEIIRNARLDWGRGFVPEDGAGVSKCDAWLAKYGSGK